MATTQAQRVGPYEIDRLLGEGAFAQVYLARDVDRGAMVALKLVRRELLDEDLVRPRFHREARALMAIEHENVISLFDYSGADAEQPFIAMERLTGRTISDIVDARGPLPVPIAAIIFSQVADGLRAAHALGLLHRDLSLTNVFVEDSGRVVIMDFGLASAVQGKRDSQTFVTRGSGVVGTPLFYAPEILQDHPYHPGSDLYAVGVAMTYALLGQPPAPVTDISELLGVILEGRLVRVEDELPETDPRLVKALHGILARDPQQRWSDAGQLVTALAPLIPRDPRTMLARWLLGEEAQTRIVALKAHENTIVRASEAGDLATALKVASDGRFILGEVIGEGGMGQVFRARDTLQKREVAVKFLHHQSDEQRLRFHREARALARLRHPNVVQLVDYSGRDAPLPYLVLELIEGATLEAVITLQAVEERVALHIALRLSEALALAHAAGIVHRDLKPENVFVDTAGRVVLTDFGIARGLAQEGTFAVRGTQAIGTPHYASPEQMLTPDRVGPPSDLFSLGSLLLALLAGGDPVEATQLVDVVSALKRGEFRALPDTVGADVRALIESLHAYEPTGRPQHADDVAKRLRALLQKRGVSDGEQALREFFGIDGSGATAVTSIFTSVGRTAVSRTAVGATVVGKTASGRTQRTNAGETAIVRGETAVTRATAPRTAVLTADTEATPRRVRVLPWALAVLAGAGVGAWLFLGPSAPEPTVITATPPEPQVIEPLPASQPARAPALPPPLPTAPPPVPAPTPIVLMPKPSPTPPKPVAAKPEPRVTPAPVAKSVTVIPATLHFITKPWANILVDGRPIGATPVITATELPPGTHALRFEHPGFTPVEQRLELKNGEVREIRVTLNK